MADIESLELQITGDAKDAKAGLDALITTLDTLKTKIQGGCGLSAIAKPISNIAGAAGKLNGSEGAKLESLAKGLQALSGLGSLKLSSSVANQISAMGNAVKNLNGVDYTKLSGLATALGPLSTLGKSNLGSVLNQIKQLPAVMTELGKVDLTAFDTKIKQLTASLKPLANEMQKVANGFSAFPAKIQKFLSSSAKVPVSNASSTASFANLAAKITATIYTIKRAASVIASWINKSNEYTENLNLFTVSMGQYATSAMEYANTVSEAMGIDTSDWIRNQGLFMTLATGFGVVWDRAATMSQQLTQLGYDISSYYNVTVEEAMQKLKSGFAGELEPLRNLGYDLSQAKLEAVALSLGIDKAVSSMTQAEKAELRYYTIMTQVTQVQGDMARTLNDPANQLRIFKAQLQMAARALGNIFIPALNAVLPYAIAVAKVIRILADAIAGLFGFEFPEMDTSGVSNLETSAGGASDAIEEATGNATKLKKTLLGIDELNVLPDTSGSGADTGASDSGFSFDLPTYDFIGEAANSRVNQIVEEMKEWLGITGEIDSWSDLLDTRLGTILKTVGLIGGALLTWKLTKGFIGGITALKTILASPSYSIAIGAVLTITGFTLAFDGMGEAIEEGLDGFNFAEILFGDAMGVGGTAMVGKTIATWISTTFAGSKVATLLTTAASNLFGAETAAAMGAGAAGAAGAALAASVASIILGIPTMIVGIYDAIVEGLDWLNSILIGTGATLTGAGIGAIIGMLGGPVTAGIGALIGLAVGLVTDLVILIVQNWEAISQWCSDACVVIGQFFTDLWDGIVSVWNTVATWFDTNVIQPVVNFFAGLWESISTTASDCWNSIVEFFTPAIEWFSELFSSVYQTISDIFYNIGVIARGCGDIVKEIWSRVSTFFSTMWTNVKTWAINAWNGIKSVFSTISTWISVKIIQPVGNFFKGLWDGFLNAAREAWQGVKTIFGKVASFFKNIFEKAWAGVVKVFSVAGDIFTDIKDGILSAFKKVVNGIIKGLNSAIAIPFNGINAALTKIRDIEILGLTPFSSLKTISIPSIPLLANGGMVSTGQMFIAREAGPEMVGSIGNKTAVANNDQIVESVSRGVYQAVVAAMGGSRGDQVVEAKVNDKVLFEVMVSRARQETVRTGYNPLLGGV